MKPLQRNRDHEIDNRIFKIREKHVMIDRDLSQLYGIETKALNQQVKRNIERFPDNFMFKLNKEEFDELVTFCDRFNTMKHSSALPNAFTEQGVAMLSAVLKSNTAIKVSIRIMESFVRMRRFFISYHDLFNKLELLESRQLKLDIEKHNSQYRPIDIRIFTKAHDRFLIIDNEVYLIGASIKDLGKKWFGFTIIESIDAEEIIHRLNY